MTRPAIVFRNGGVSGTQPGGRYEGHRKLHRRREDGSASARYYAGTEAQGVAHAQAVRARIQIMPGLSDFEIAEIEQRIRILQERVGYTGGYDSWMASVTPPVTAGRVNFPTQITRVTSLSGNSRTIIASPEGDSFFEPYPTGSRAKILLWDWEHVCIGSFNWLSARSKSPRVELSLLVSGAFSQVVCHRSRVT